MSNQRNPLLKSQASTGHIFSPDIIIFGKNVCLVILGIFRIRIIWGQNLVQYVKSNIVNALDTMFLKSF